MLSVPHFCNARGKQKGGGSGKRRHPENLQPLHGQKVGKPATTAEHLVGGATSMKTGLVLKEIHTFNP